MKLDPKDYIYRPEISSYNYNHYRNVVTGQTILEICHEDENYFDYFLVEGALGDIKTPIGSSFSQDGLDGDEVIELSQGIG